jgi:hypothetical protein
MSRIGRFGVNWQGSFRKGLLRRFSATGRRARCDCVRLAVLLAVGAGLLACGQAASAGFITISQLHPYNPGGRTPFISGIAFDDQANPWVSDGWSWGMQRLDETSGAVLEIYAPTPAATSNNSLAWSPASGEFYTNYTSALYRINRQSNTRTVVGYSMQSFNFSDLAFSPSGSLWQATDHNGGELWSVNTATSAETLVCGITGLGINQQVHALAIDQQGQFFVATSAYRYNGNVADNRIYGVDPQTGTASLVAQWDDDVGAYIQHMSIDPTTGRWYGIRQARGLSPWGHYFVELTNVPEPATTTLLGVAAACGLTVGWRRAARRRGG